MPSPDPGPFRLFTRRLEALGLPYAVTGGVAAIYYGEPRLTNDVDIVVVLRAGDAARISNAFPSAEFYCPPPEVILIEHSRPQRGHFNLIHHETGFKADIYVAGEDPLHAWAIGHAAPAEIGGEVVRFAPPEYVVLRKLQFFREGGSPKHLRDISRMLDALGEGWSRDTLLEFVARHGLGEEWERVQSGYGQR
jgi:hypothetical protein